jgi:hypothetical protein
LIPNNVSLVAEEVFGLGLAKSHRFEPMAARPCFTMLQHKLPRITAVIALQLDSLNCSGLVKLERYFPGIVYVNKKARTNNAGLKARSSIARWERIRIVGHKRLECS